jgi:hypothetical protein
MPRLTAGKRDNTRPSSVWISTLTFRPALMAGAAVAQAHRPATRGKAIGVFMGASFNGLVRLDRRRLKFPPTNG